MTTLFGPDRTAPFQLPPSSSFRATAPEVITRILLSALLMSGMMSDQNFTAHWRNVSSGFRFRCPPSTVQGTALETAVRSGSKPNNSTAILRNVRHPKDLHVGSHRCCRGDRSARAHSLLPVPIGVDARPWPSSAIRRGRVHRSSRWERMGCRVPEKQQEMRWDSERMCFEQTSLSGSKIHASVI